MIPLYSDRPLARFPFVTLLLIVANIAVFIHQITMTGGLERSVSLYGMIPRDLMSHAAVAALFSRGDVAPVGRLLTSMFAHGGLVHLGGNMLYLWVFGRNVEDDLGHLRFLGFYLMAGIVATAAFAGAFPDGGAPLVGASGAIAGVLGVYFLRFPSSRIHCLFIFIIFVRIIAVPAFIILGFWFALQVGSCMAQTTAAAGAAGQGGIAWVSHVAGFTFGLVWTIIELRRRHKLRGYR